jgi:hypothetical protein
MQHNRCGRADSAHRVALAVAVRQFSKLAAIRRASSLLSNLAADLRPGSSSQRLTWCSSYQAPKVWT